MFSRISASLFRNEVAQGEEAAPLTRTNSSSLEEETDNHNRASSSTYGAVSAPGSGQEAVQDNGFLWTSSNGDFSDSFLDGRSSSSTTADQSNTTVDPDDEEDETIRQEEADAAATSDDIDDALTALTRRLRCLFSVVTWPIVPLGSICILGLIWLLYASFVLDMHETCSHPLHWYSVTSMLFLFYLPFHTSIRSYFFHYDRDRDGPNRPVSVRRYDQCFNTVALLYVYAGITIVTGCRDDLMIPDGSTANAATSAAAAAAPNLDMASLNNTCAATCPNTFASLRVYVACLELFVLSLIIPLLFLPCLYLYFVRRTMQDAEALSILQERLREEEALRRNGGITAEQIMDYFERVHLVVDPRTIDHKILIVPRATPTTTDPGKDKESSAPESSSSLTINFAKATECDTKECCICMKNFKIKETNDIEAGNAGNEDAAEDRIVRTSQTCSHLFHERCILSWVGGRWEAGGSNECRPARHTTCPLCRRDFRPGR